tara:strand:- start:463 stop:618 length:156 start_codon:yes stop_codon:yes gene_type:complete
MKSKTSKLMSQKDLYNFMFGEEFMNSPVKGTIQEYEYMEEKVNDFKNKLNK